MASSPGSTAYKESQEDIAGSRSESRSFEEQCEQATEALAQSNVLLLVTGAGWSADSNLAVYGDIAKVPAYQQNGWSYADVSHPSLVQSDPELFYGFWAQSFNDYRKTRPHDGYDIVTKWRDEN